MGVSRGGRAGGPDPPLKNHKNIVFRNTGPEDKNL